VTHSALIVGLGAIGMGYDFDHAEDRVYSHARAFATHAAFGPVSAVDSDENRRAAYVRRYGGPAYATLAEAFASRKPDVVIIATPTGSHASLVEQVLRAAAPRAILCEKPLAADLAQAKAIVTGCEARGVDLFVNYMRRAEPGAIAVREMIADGRLAAPLKGVVWYSKGVRHNGSHFIDLMRFWLGDVREARIVRPGRLWDGDDPEPDFLLEHARGAVTYLAAREECFSHYTAELIGANGRVYYARGGEAIYWQRLIADPEFAGYTVLEPDERIIEGDMPRYQWHVLEQLRRALAGETHTLCTGRDALATLADVFRVTDQLRGN
jgi:predicted dehydrogenase